MVLTCLSPNSGNHPEFEVRFREHATSRRMGTPPETRMIQVNLRTGNTRVVRGKRARRSRTGSFLARLRGEKSSERASCSTTTLEWTDVERGSLVPPPSEASKVQGTPNVAQWLSSILTSLERESVEAIAAKLKETFDCRGPRHLLKISTDGLVACGVPKWSVDRLVAEIVEIRATHGCFTGTST